MLDIQMRVRCKETGRLATTCPTSQFLREDGPISLRFDGDSVTTTLLAAGGESAFEILGPENAVASLDKCKGCIYLSLRGTNFTCERYGYLGEDIYWKSGSMRSDRDPIVPYPDCQTDERKKH